MFDEPYRNLAPPPRAARTGALKMQDMEMMAMKKRDMKMRDIK